MVISRPELSAVKCLRNGLVAKRLQKSDKSILIRGVPLVLLGYLKSSAVLLHAMGSRSFCFCDPCSLRCCLGTQTWVVPVLFRLRRRPRKASERSILMRSISWLYMKTEQRQAGKTLVLHLLSPSFISI